MLIQPFPAQCLHVDSTTSGLIKGGMPFTPGCLTTSFTSRMSPCPWQCGHKTMKMTDRYNDDRGKEWIVVGKKAV
ncbi:Phage lambda integrase [Klebsiella pneumoniae subsp. pneumoniae Kp13]|nr:Phage lambda integrase [Klebsiella pneumoniae subsp. pneumoniae Kp13]